MVIEYILGPLAVQLGASHTEQLVQSVPAGTSIEIDAHGAHIALDGAQPDRVRIESGLGVFEPADAEIADQQELHTGAVVIQNKGRRPAIVRLIRLE